MNADEVIQIIDKIPEYIKFIYPGYLTIYVYRFLRARDMTDSKAAILKSLGISYIYIQFLELLKLNNNFIIENLFLLIMAVIVPYCAYLFVRSEMACALFESFEIETTYMDNEVDALQGFDKGAWLVLYLNDAEVVYEGYIDYKELEDGKRQYICLKNYYKYLIDDKGKPIEPYIEDHEKEPDEKVVIFYKDIKRIEKRSTVETGEDLDKEVKE